MKKGEQYRLRDAIVEDCKEDFHNFFDAVSSAYILNEEEDGTQPSPIISGGEILYPNYNYQCNLEQEMPF